MPVHPIAHDALDDARRPSSPGPRAAQQHGGEKADRDTYVLGTGPRGQARLALSEEIYGPQTQRLFRDVRREHLAAARGVSMAVFGCGSGAQLASLCDFVGPTGRLLLTDSSAEQVAAMEVALEAAAPRVADVQLQVADITQASGSGDYDVVYARFLLVHLRDPAGAVRNMRSFARPGGLVVCDEHDVADIRSLPATPPLEAFASLVGRLGRSRGVDFCAGRRIEDIFAAAGLPTRTCFAVCLTVREPRHKALTATSFEEALPAYVENGLASAEALDDLVGRVWAVARDTTTRVIVGSQWQCYAVDAGITAKR